MVGRLRPIHGTENAEAFMPYIPDNSIVSMEQAERRLLETDLIPSLQPLRTNANEIFHKLRKRSIANLGALRAELKTKAKIKKLAADSSIDEALLVLLNREIGGWIPKVREIDEFTWIETKDLEALKKAGVRSSADAYSLLDDENTLAVLRASGLEAGTIEEVARISRLLRVRWISPAFGKVIDELGYDVAGLRGADAARLTQAIDELNKRKSYYKGKVGERDIRRLIHEAGYVEQST